MPQPSPGLKIASVRGVPIYIGRSWPLIAAVIVALFGPSVARIHPEWGVGAYGIAVAYALLLLVSVLAHELAHAITGQLCGYTVNRIVADLWGGHTTYESPDATPGRSAIVAAVGPLSNAALSFLGFLALMHVPGESAGHLLLWAFTWSNGFVALFNALPGLPLDGGFVVDALVWKATGSRAKGMKAAGWCGRLVAVAVAAWALWPLLNGHEGALWNLAWRLAIAAFLWRGASTAVTVGTNREFLGGIRVRQVVRQAVGVDAETPLAKLPDTHEIPVLIDESGHPVAFVPPGAHVQVPLEARRSVPASAVALALDPQAVATVENWDDDVVAVLPAFDKPEPPATVTVLDSAGRVTGLVSQTDLERAFARHAEHLDSSA